MDFIAFVVPELTLVERVREHCARMSGPVTSDECLLVSSPGYGVLDSGCGRTIVGERTLHEFQSLWKVRGIQAPKWQSQMNSFRFGNGETEVSHWTVAMPLRLAGKVGTTISAAVVKGSAPLLISRGALQASKASIDFATNRIRLFDEQIYTYPWKRTRLDSTS